MSQWRRYWSAFQAKRFVFILSTMRSGSTLLKSLLAVPEQTSHLPEVHFHKYKFLASWRLKALSEKPIIVLKKPSWVNESMYPNLPPVRPYKSIILIRHPYETILSIEKMQKELKNKDNSQWSRKELLDYWCRTYEQLTSKDHANALMVRYESLTQNPISETERIFQFLDINHPGIDTYKKPTSYQWSWLNDDGGEKIKQLKVSPAPLNRKDQSLVQLIQENEKVNALLDQFGYNENSGS